MFKPLSFKPLSQGAVVGILGGGQLGRMLAVAASRLGLRTHIYEPLANPPAAQVADRVTTAGYDDHPALRAFAASVDVLTYEFENIPAAALDVLAQICPIFPNRKALEISQDRVLEKDFLTNIGLTTAPYVPVHSLADLKKALGQIGMPAILKTTRLGYDGKGQARIYRPDDMAQALAAMGGQDAVLEGFVDFQCEISVIAARAHDGTIACYDPGENLHQNGILHQTTVPATIAAHICMDAVLLAGRILNALDYVGVMGVELFVTSSGLIVNEIAPRVHNSGHWTQNGCAVDQFEQHIRAISGWPLGDGTRHSDVRMVNLIGDDVNGLPELMVHRDAAIHLYGKDEARAGRKMGHVNYMLRKTS